MRLQTMAGHQTAFQNEISAIPIKALIEKTTFHNTPFLAKRESHMESWLPERAKDELEILQTKHLGSRFDYLKLELKALISESHDHCESFPSCKGEEAVCTQGNQL